MAKFKFPRNPNANHSSPFADEHGRNPFGDDVQAEPAAEAEEPSQTNPYVAREPSAVQPYQPGEYETFLPHRGRLIFRMGVIGFSLQLLGMPAAATGIFATGEFLQGIVYGLPGSLIGLAVAIPAWIMGHTDSLAVESGAMQADGARSTRAGLRFGIAGTMLGVAQLLIFFGLIVYNDFFV